MVVALDASVLAKLFLEEPGSDDAERLIETHRVIHAPEIVRLEVASAITRAYRRNSIDLEEARQKLVEWRQFLTIGSLHIAPTESVMEKSQELSLQIRHPLADCFYLAVSLENGVPLITADKPFFDLAVPIYPNVRHLLATRV